MIWRNIFMHLEQDSNLEQIKELIKKAKSILILTHENPDGDAVGSSLGLMNGIKKLGEKIEKDYKS